MISRENRTEQKRAEPGGKRDGAGRFVKGQPSANPAGRGGKGHIHADQWINGMTGWGDMSRDKRLNSYHRTWPVTIAEAEDLWQGDDIAARIVEVLPSEVLREGFEFCIADDGPLARAVKKAKLARPEPVAGAPAQPMSGMRAPVTRADAYAEPQGREQVDQVQTAYEDLGLVEAIWLALCYSRAYGFGAVLMGANDGQKDWSQPLQVDKITSLDYLTPLEARDLTPAQYYTNTRSKKYGQVATYWVNPLPTGNPVEKNPTYGVQGQVVHESRLLVFDGIRVARIHRSTATLGHGDSVFTRCKDPLREYENALMAAGVLLADFAQGVYKIHGLADLLASKGEEGRGTLLTRLRAVEDGRSSLRAMLIDQEHEDFTRLTTPVTGLAELIDRKATRLAAAADMPLTLLMGQSPAGLNATGESDIRFFYDRVAAWSRRKVLPQVRYVTRIILRAILGPDAPEKWHVRMRPLWQATEKEQAETRLTQAQVDAIEMDHGVITSAEVRASRHGGAQWSSDTRVDMEDEFAEYSAPDGEDVGDPSEPLPVPGEPDPNDPNAPSSDPAADPNAPPAAPAPAESVQSQAMNGAQVTAMIAVVTAYGTKTIPRDAAIEMLVVGFPGLISREQATTMCPEDFEAPKPEPPPSPFGGGKPGGGGSPFPGGKEPGQDPAESGQIVPSGKSEPPPAAPAVKQDHVEKRGEKWVLVAHDDPSRVLGTYDTEADADAAMVRAYAHKKDAPQPRDAKARFGAGSSDTGIHASAARHGKGEHDVGRGLSNDPPEE